MRAKRWSHSPKSRLSPCLSASPAVAKTSPIVLDELFAICASVIDALGQRGAWTISTPSAESAPAASGFFTTATNRRSRCFRRLARRDSGVMWPLPPPSSQANRTVFMARNTLGRQRLRRYWTPFRFDGIEAGLQILDLTRFLDANRFIPRIKSGAGLRLKTPLARDEKAL